MAVYSQGNQRAPPELWRVQPVGTSEFVDSDGVNRVASVLAAGNRAFFIGQDNGPFETDRASFRHRPGRGARVDPGDGIKPRARDARDRAAVLYVRAVTVCSSGLPKTVRRSSCRPLRLAISWKAPEHFVSGGPPQVILIARFDNGFGGQEPRSAFGCRGRNRPGGRPGADALTGLGGNDTLSGGTANDARRRGSTTIPGTAAGATKTSSAAMM